jgi:xylulokinase
LGIDIGTSSVKVVVIDAAGSLVETQAVALPISRPQPLWSEQNADDWWDASHRAVLALPSNLRSAIKAIGLSGQMHGATLLGEDLKPLRPAILWNDGRSFQACDTLAKREPDFVSRGGNLVMPGFTAPKLEWVRTHEPDLFERVCAVLLPKDYVRLCMTGELASDMSDSAGTLWMDVEKRDWHDPLLSACGLSRDQMPKLYEGNEITGTLLPRIANEWGMDCVPVIAGAGDNAAGAIGAGVISEGDALMSLGTSGVIFVSGNRYRSNPASAVHAFCHALPDTWHLMSVMLSAASCLDWAASMTGTGSVADLIAMAEAEDTLAIEEIFLPYLSGERTPHNNPHASGVLYGMSHDTSRARIAQAVLEGVALSMADGLAGLVEAGAAVETISVIGGGSQSSYWGRVLSGALNRPLIYRDGAATGPAFGAARLARQAITKDEYKSAFAPPTIIETIEPNAKDVEILQAKHERYRALYANLENTFH